MIIKHTDETKCVACGIDNPINDNIELKLNHVRMRSILDDKIMLCNNCTNKIRFQLKQNNSLILNELLAIIK
jgi:hypothetical protein